MATVALQQQQVLLPDSILEEIFVLLPRKAFHRCRCLSRAWATTLSSDYFVDRNLGTRGKMRLNHDDLMKSLAFGCCHYRGKEEETAAKNRVRQAEIEAIKRATLKKRSTKMTNYYYYDNDEEEDHIDRREEYRTRGYVQVDMDYQFTLNEVRPQRWRIFDYRWMNIHNLDENRKLVTIPYGGLHPLIRQPLLDKDGDTSDYFGGYQNETKGYMNGRPKTGREKTEEEIDQEIIAFLRRCHNMDPRPQFLEYLDTYGWSMNP